MTPHTLIGITLLAVATAACGSKEGSATAGSQAPPMERTAAGANQAPAAGSAAKASASGAATTPEEQQVLDSVPTMDDARAAAEKDVTDQNADKVLEEIRKELGGGR